MCTLTATSTGPTTGWRSVSTQRAFLTHLALSGTVVGIVCARLWYLRWRKRRIAQRRRVVTAQHLLHGRIARHHHLEQGIGVDCITALFEYLLADMRFKRWREQRPVHDQFNLRRAVIDRREASRRRLFPEFHRLAFNALNQGHDAPVFQPGLIVKVFAKLFRQTGDRALCRLTGLQPVVMDA